jgi:hypothetical protein
MDLYNAALSFFFGMMLIIVPFLALELLLMLRRDCATTHRAVLGRCASKTQVEFIPWPRYRQRRVCTVV